jgi:hypothetical protein
MFSVCRHDAGGHPKVKKRKVQLYQCLVSKVWELLDAEITQVQICLAIFHEHICVYYTP